MWEDGDKMSRDAVVLDLCRSRWLHQRRVRDRGRRDGDDGYSSGVRHALPRPAYRGLYSDRRRGSACRGNDVRGDSRSRDAEHLEQHKSPPSRFNPAKRRCASYRPA